MAARPIDVDVFPDPADPRAYFHIGRDIVEALDIQSAVEAFERLIATRDMAEAYCGHVSLIFDGYEDDPLDLWCIPAVRAFLADLDKAFPWFFWFLDPKGSSLLLLAACCCGTTTSVAASGKTSVSFPSVVLEAFLFAHCDAAEVIRRRFDFAAEDLGAVVRPILEYFRVPRAGWLLIGPQPD
jgi:hypothetical protein